MTEGLTGSVGGKLWLQWLTASARRAAAPPAGRRGEIER